MSNTHIEDLCPSEVICRAMRAYPKEILPLFEYLDFKGWTDSKLMEIDEVTKKKISENVFGELRKMGSNDFATLMRGGEPVDYHEVVCDVGEKLGANVSKSNKVYQNEMKILEKVFTDILHQMSVDERKELARNLKVDGKEINAASPAMMASLILGNAFGFGTYRVAMIVANFVAKALLGRGLAFATNAALTRSIGVFLGPVGWIASGAWLAIDIAGPAYRKTVPSVIQIALLRSMLKARLTIGIVGDGSSGKDSLIKAVFNIDTKNISPIAGSTSTYKEYELDDKGIYLINYPGHNDFRSSVNDEIKATLNQTDVFIIVTDISRGTPGTDVRILEDISSLGKPTLVCANKIDAPRPQDLDVLKKTALERLVSADHLIFTSFDPDPRFSSERMGCIETYKWLVAQVETCGKTSENIPKPKT